MYLTLVALPLLGSIVSGFFGRKVGVTGAHIITCICVISTTILAILVFIEVGFNNIPTSIYLFRWVDSEYLNVSWSFNFDSLTVSMLIPVLIISSLVHLYSIGYMSHDPHNQRFFSYLSLFTFMMIILVTANNFLLMFVGWEGVGVCSYLLVSFWFTRLAANQSSMSAFLTNRIGDCFLTIGMFALIWTFGNIDYNTIFSLAPYFNENVITLIGICLLIGAMAKSSQIGLHVWLPLAMEGPTPVSALIHAATMVTAGVYLLIRSSPLIEYSSTVLVLCLWIGAITTIFSSLIGLFQQDIKKVIAYSTMSQLGMMVIAVGLSSYTIALFHLMNHAFYKGLLFLGAGAVIHSVTDNQDFRKYGSLIHYLPLTYSVMLIASLSLVAIPFMSGFYSKDLILESAFGNYGYFGIIVYYIATIGAMFTTLYSTKVLYLTFLTNPNGPIVNYRKETAAHEGDIFISTPLVILAVFSIFFGYFTKDIYIGMGSGLFSDNSVFIHTNHEILLDTEFAVPVYFKLLPFLFTISLLTIYILFSEIIPQMLISFKLSNLGYNIFGFLNQRFLIDHYYNKYIVHGILNLGSQTTIIMDKGFIERFGPFGLENSLNKLSKNIDDMSTGLVTTYGLYILMGIISYISILNFNNFNNNLLILLFIILFINFNYNINYVIISVNKPISSFMFSLTLYGPKKNLPITLPKKPLKAGEDAYTQRLRDLEDQTNIGMGIYTYLRGEPSDDCIEKLMTLAYLELKSGRDLSVVSKAFLMHFSDTPVPYRGNLLEVIREVIPEHISFNLQKKIEDNRTDLNKEITCDFRPEDIFAEVNFPESWKEKIHYVLNTVDCFRNNNLSKVSDTSSDINTKSIEKLIQKDISLSPKIIEDASNESTPRNIPLRKSLEDTSHMSTPKPLPPAWKFVDPKRMYIKETDLSVAAKPIRGLPYVVSRPNIVAENRIHISPVTFIKNNPPVQSNLSLQIKGKRDFFESRPDISGFHFFEYIRKISFVIQENNTKINTSFLYESYVELHSAYDKKSENNILSWNSMLYLLHKGYYRLSGENNIKYSDISNFIDKKFNKREIVNIYGKLKEDYPNIKHIGEKPRHCYPMHKKGYYNSKELEIITSSKAEDNIIPFIKKIYEARSDSPKSLEPFFNKLKSSEDKDIPIVQITTPSPLSISNTSDQEDNNTNTGVVISNNPSPPGSGPNNGSNTGNSSNNYSGNSTNFFSIDINNFIDVYTCNFNSFEIYIYCFKNVDVIDFYRFIFVLFFVIPLALYNFDKETNYIKLLIYIQKIRLYLFLDKLTNRIRVLLTENYIYINLFLLI